VFPETSGFIWEEETMRSGRLILVLVALFLIASATAQAYEEEVLRGLKSVCVMVAPISPDMEELGLSAAELKEEVELHLRQAKVKLLSPKYLYRKEGCSGILIRVNGDVFRVGRERLVACDIHLGVMELVQLTRSSQVPIIPAQTWGYESEMILAKTSQMAKINQAVNELVDRFIRDYHNANQR
jgi:hypothetical protein